MPRQYVSLRVCGTPNETLNKVRYSVRSLGVGHVVQVVHFQKQARREYYFFLGYDTPTAGQVPPEVNQVIERAGFGGGLLGPFALAEIRDMLDPQEFDTTGTDRIPYRSRWVEEAGDLFDLMELPAFAAAPRHPELSRRFDRLLGWLSAAGEGRWESFERACQMTEVASDPQQARNVSRLLTLLGHIEPSAEGRAWAVCPPVLVREASHPERGFLCGLRIPSWSCEFCPQNAAAEEDQVAGAGPHRLAIPIPADAPQGPAGLPIRMRSEALSVTLADLVPDLEGWERGLEPVVGLTNPQRAERWENNQYVEVQDFYYRGGHYHGPTGLYRVTRGDGRRQGRLTFFFDEAAQRFVRGDWFGLRFLAQARAEMSFSATWRATNGSGELIVPAQHRWPMLYERALVLASGYLPHQTSGNGALQYPEIPRTVAKSLTDRLGVSLEIVA
jgi:hypothetical protein